MKLDVSIEKQSTSREQFNEEDDDDFDEDDDDYFSDIDEDGKQIVHGLSKGPNAQVSFLLVKNAFAFYNSIFFIQGFRRS